ncbi:MAG: hypothetical protein JNL01_07400 [Bdellovibrionales bacterium]|nr:hypothetical protein [Bdellovibrionales bacterium]
MIILRLWAFGLLCASPTFAASKAVENPVFAYTHLLPSPYTMPAGRLVLGTDIAFGLFDSVQVSSNVIRDIYKTYNAQIKVQVYDSHPFALAVTGGWEFYNLRSLDSGNPDLDITILSPGLVAAVGLGDSVAWFVGGNKSIFNVPVNFSGVTSSSFLRGTVAQSDLTWAYLASGKKGISNVVAVGASYDVDYKLLGVGLSHYWGGFRVGFHYYPKAESNPVLPLITGSTVVNL